MSTQERILQPLQPFGHSRKRHFNLKVDEELQAEAFVRKRLCATSAMHFNVCCIAPGQQNPLHRLSGLG